MIRRSWLVERTVEIPYILTWDAKDISEKYLPGNDPIKSLEKRKFQENSLEGVRRNLVSVVSNQMLILPV